MWRDAFVSSEISHRDFFAEYEIWLKRRRRLYWLLTFLLFLSTMYLIVYFTVMWNGIIERSEMHIGMFAVCFFVVILYKWRESIRGERAKRPTVYEKACHAYQASQAGLKPEEFRSFINKMLNEEDGYFAEISSKHINMTKDFIQAGRRVVWADEILLIYYRESEDKRAILSLNWGKLLPITFNLKSSYHICFYTKPFGEIAVIDLKRLKIGGSKKQQDVQARWDIMLALSDLYPKAVLGTAQSPGGVNLKLWNWAIHTHEKYKDAM